MSSIPPNDQGTPHNPNDPYAVREEPAATIAGPGPAESATIWYVARLGGQREGPINLDVIKQRIVAGSLTATDLAWREGMTGWIAIREVPELARLFNKPASPGTQKPMNAPPAVPFESAPPPGASYGAKDWTNWPQLPPRIETLLSSPKFFRMVGRTCALGSVVLAMTFGAVILLSFAVTIHWVIGNVLNWALILALIFFVCEAAAAVLSKLAKSEGPESKT